MGFNYYLVAADKFKYIQGAAQRMVPILMLYEDVRKAYPDLLSHKFLEADVAHMCMRDKTGQYLHIGRRSGIKFIWNIMPNTLDSLAQTMLIVGENCTWNDADVMTVADFRQQTTQCIHHDLSMADQGIHFS